MAGWRALCEFKVLLDGKVVLTDIVYVRAKNGKLLLKDVLGIVRELDDCEIVEVDVPNERLVLRYKVSEG